MNIAEGDSTEEGYSAGNRNLLFTIAGGDLT